MDLVLSPTYYIIRGVRWMLDFSEICLKYADYENDPSSKRYLKIIKLWCYILVLLISSYSLKALLMITYFSYKKLLHHIWKHEIKFNPKNNELFGELLLKRIEWMNNHLRHNPLIIINVNRYDSDVIFAFFSESDLMAYKLRWFE